MNVQVPFQKSRFHSSSILPLFVLVTLLIQVLLLLMIFFQGNQLQQLVNKPAPSLVQMIDGRVTQVSTEQANYRSPMVIQQLVNQWAMMTYTWSGKLPVADATQARQPLDDPGIPIDNNGKLPTAAAHAAFLITDENNFRREFLKKLSSLVPQGVFSGNQQTVLRISQILPPQQIGQGRWDVNVYAYMEVLDVSQPVGNPIKINQKISLRAVPPPRYPLPNGLSTLQQAIYRLGEAGLEIVQIENILN